MGIYTGTVPTFLAGELPDADKFTEISNFMTAATSAWTSYSSTWRASGTQPALGSGGSVAAFYLRLGKAIDATILLTIGSGATFGTGFYYFDLPVAAVRAQSGKGWVFDVSGGAFYGSYGVISNVGALSPVTLSHIVAFDSATHTVLGPTVPVTLAAGDMVQLGITYEAA